MEASKHIPIAATAVDKLPPKRLRQLLRPDEQIVWWARGRGHLWDTIATLVLSAAALALIVVLSFRVAIGGWLDWAPFVGFPAIALATFYMLRAALGARFHIYGLTNHRVLYIPGFPSILWFGLHRDGGSGGAIHTLHATGGADRGNLRLQTQFVQHSWFNKTGVRLTGIADPVGVAELIRSTLKLPIEVENRTR